MLRSQPIKTTAAAALALAAIGPASAAASPNRDLGATTQRQSPATPIVRVITPSSGFAWGDAGIGAAGGLALSMLGLGAALAVSQRRPRHP